MASERDDEVPNVYVRGDVHPSSDLYGLLVIANELAELRRLTAERNELLRENNAQVQRAQDNESKRIDEARRLANAFEHAAELEERLAKVESVAHAPVSGLVKSDYVDHIAGALKERLDDLAEDVRQLREEAGHA